MTRAEIAETIILILSIGALWPAVFRFTAPWYTAVLVVVLSLMVVILVRRVKRMNEAFRQAEQAMNQDLPSGLPPFLNGPGNDPAERN